MTKGLTAAKGKDCNKIKLGGITRLMGDKNVKLEKPYTIIHFPGGSVEISRTTDGEYWVHVASHAEFPEDKPALIADARIDAQGRYCDTANQVLKEEVEKGDIRHVAFRFRPRKGER